MALLSMAVYDTEENQRSQFTEKTLFGSPTIAGVGHGLINSVDWYRHRMIIVDNGSCEETRTILRRFAGEVNGWSVPKEIVTIIPLPENIGTAKAINKALKFRKPDEYFIKMDNDILVHQSNWVDEMIEVMQRMPQIGILGLKRNDLLESPYAINTDQRSRLLMVEKTPEQRWRVVEDCKHIMGTCTMLSPELLKRLGYFYQMDGLYGFDDSLMCVRSTVAGFMNCFLLGVDIDHIDPGGTAYTEWKEKYAGEMLTKYAAAEAAYKSGVKDVYYAGE